MADDKNKGELISAGDGMKVYEFKGQGAENLLKVLQEAGLPIKLPLMEAALPGAEQDDGKPWNLEELTNSFNNFLDDGVDRFVSAMHHRGSTNMDIYNALHIAFSHHVGMVERSLDKIREMEGAPRASIEPQRERQLELGRAHSTFHLNNPTGDCPEDPFGFQVKREV